MGKHAMNPIKEVIQVAVFGSCATRDNFNRTFNPGYKDLFECVALCDHVSLVSLMAPPLKVDPAKLDGVQPRAHKNLLREYSRAFLAELLTTQPDYLIMDFWSDLIFGFADLDDGHTITHNAWTVTKTEFFKEHTATHLRPDKSTEVFFERWRRAADAFFAYAGTQIPNTRIIVHSARNLRYWMDKDGVSHDFGPWSVGMNKHWEAMDSYVLDRHASRQINVMLPGMQSYEGHPWGKYPVHYTSDYHSRFLSALSEIALRDIVGRPVKARA